MSEGTSAMKRRAYTLLAALVFIGGVAAGCSGPQPTARQPLPDTTPVLGPASYSFIRTERLIREVFSFADQSLGSYPCVSM